MQTGKHCLSLHQALGVKLVVLIAMVYEQVPPMGIPPLLSLCSSSSRAASILPRETVGYLAQPGLMCCPSVHTCRVGIQQKKAHAQEGPQYYQDQWNPLIQSPDDSHLIVMPIEITFMDNGKSTIIWYPKTINVLIFKSI
jgi:hypothetical protein